jgi:hypothetical protein
MRRQDGKIGHQAPKRWRYNRYFNYITIRGDLHYCASHDFVYNCEEEERKLYNAEPCHYTDGRYVDTMHNYYKDCHLYFSRSRWKRDITLKSCIRKTLKCRNIPVGTIVEFTRDWYFSDKKIDLRYCFKVKKENYFDPQYEINLARYSRNFDNDQWAQELTEELRANGFLVGVSKGNTNFISNMISTAAAYTGQHHEASQEEGQTAIAYGHGMKIGFSTGRDTFMGYSNGCDNVLFDYFQEFDKWSRCLEISKDLTPKEIVVELLKPREDEIL